MGTTNPLSARWRSHLTDLVANLLNYKTVLSPKAVLHDVNPADPPWNNFPSTLDKQYHCYQQRLAATLNMDLPPLSAQWAYLICYQAGLLREGGVGSACLLPRHRSSAGPGHFHQTACEIQRETQALQSVSMLLLHSEKTRAGRQRKSECGFAFSLHKLQQERRQAIWCISMFHSWIPPLAFFFHNNLSYRH